MLTSLSIRNVVLIDQLDLSFEPGLCVLTGETGAGKSILLDALGLALGGRSEARLLRAGTDQATVTAAFSIAPGHPVWPLLEDQGIAVEPGEEIILRRQLAADGRTRAFINDQPASIGLLRQAGDLLIEIQGQFDQRGLLDPATHLGLLDAFAGLAEDAARARSAHSAWRRAEQDLREIEAHLAQARADEDFLRHAVAELDELAPESGEEERLQAERTLLMNRERLIEALNSALAEVTQPLAAEDALRQAARALERVADKAGGAFDEIIAAFDRAVAETADAITRLEQAGESMDVGAERLQLVDDRLFALRDVARKHRVEADALPALRDELTANLDALDSQSGDITRLAEIVEQSRRAYTDQARALSKKRAAAGAKLDKAVAGELPPLKLDRAAFVTRVETLDEADWGPAGMDRVTFEVATNPGAAPGPLNKIASGGELSRFMLALKVVLTRGSPVPTLVFDEVDSGIGGATAAAAGDRLLQLAATLQILVVTHSPQVAARGLSHWRVEKADSKGGVNTRVSQLDPAARREEIARMLAGRDITDEARAAADALIAGEAA